MYLHLQFSFIGSQILKNIFLWKNRRKCYLWFWDASFHFHRLVQKEFDYILQNIWECIQTDRQTDRRKHCWIWHVFIWIVTASAWGYQCGGLHYCKLVSLYIGCPAFNESLSHFEYSVCLSVCLSGKANLTFSHAGVALNTQTYGFWFTKSSYHSGTVRR
jgi:hypothetical protein